MIRLVDGLQRNLLHNVSDDLEEVLALGHQLQGSLSSKAKSWVRNDPFANAASSAESEEENSRRLHLGKPMSWFNRAESILQRHFTAQRVVVELGRFDQSFKTM